QADLDQTPVDGERGQILAQIARADVIQDDVHAATFRQLRDARAEVLLPVVDGRGRPERDAAGRLVGAADGDVAGMALLAEQHDRRGADAATAPVDEYALA